MAAVLAVLAALVLSLAAPGGARAAATAPPGVARAAAARPGAGLLTQAQALAQARATGKPVAVTAATTDTSTLTANPGGTLTFTESSAPVRVMQQGRWVPTDATLRRDGAGTVSPAAAAGYLRLSGGGRGPLAVLASAGHTLTVSLPGVRLPAPSLSGATATYPGVLPGVDLEVTADTTGGYSDVLVVKDAAAARNPALRHLAFTMAGAGLRMQAGPRGTLSFATARGHVVFAGPAPVMYDSRAVAGPARSAVSPATGRRTDLRTGQPLTSAVAGPGEAARTAPVAVTVAGTTVTDSPDAALLGGPGTVYPLYIDPPMGSTLQYWGQVDSAWPAQTYPKPSFMQVGYDGWAAQEVPPATTFTARSFVRESWPSILRDSSSATVTIYSSTLYLQDAWAPTCNTSAGDFGVQVWLTGSVSTSTTWNSQPTWSADQQNKSFAYGYDSSCPENTAGFSVLGAARSAAANKWTNVTFGIRADSESDEYGWKQFTHTVTMSTTYDWQPTVSSPSTSPATTCGADDTVGLGDVMLYVQVASPEGGAAGSLYPTVKVADTATGAVIQTTTATTGYASGATYPVLVPQATLKNAAGASATEFTWTATVTDNTLTSSTLTCHFTFDPTIPGAPSVTGCATTAATIGSPVTFAITPNPAGTVPTGYHVQLNAAAPQGATMTGSGNATVTLTPTRGVNALTVTGYSAGGNLGQSFTCVFDAVKPANAADADMTGDAIPDLVTAGGPGTGLPSGLWLAKGQPDASLTAGDGQVITSPADIGVEGNGFTGDYKPSDFDGGQVITGLFAGNGLQDTLVYYPSGTYAGEGTILYGNGDGSTLESQDASNTKELDANVLADGNSDNPMQVVNAYNAYSSDSAGYPDLITRSGDASGYYLAYFQNGGAAGSWIYGFNLTNPAPDGTMDWNNWTIATMAEPSGSIDMFLSDTATGALWLWQGFTVNDNPDGTDTAAYTPYQLSGSWSPGTVASLHAADITGTGPAIWGVTTAGTATAWTTTLTGTPAVTGGTAQTLLAPTHSWRLGDGTAGQATTAADTGSGTALPLAGNSGATWSGSDLFYPAVQFDGTTGAMTSSGPALTATASFSVSVWVKPNTLNGAFLGQTGSSTSCMGLAVNPVTVNGVTYGHYAFGMTGANSSTAPNWDKATAGLPMELGIWSHITATYNASAKFMSLYVDGIPTATATPSATWSSGCNTFTLGRFTDGGTATRYFNGKVADVQVWAGTALTPTQIATLSGTPGYTLFPSDSHHYASAATSTTWQWTTAHGQMNFYQGKISIKETGTGTSTVTFGPGGNPSAVLTLQTDGNLVIYPSAADATANTGAVWASNTAGNPGDVMFFQPDGNLVIYNTYGKVLWVSNTAN